MDDLFSHPGFRLIGVYDDGSISLIIPLEHKENITKIGYRCISHLWGHATRWEDHPINGVTWSVNVREEKRAKLLQIFNHYRGYWWMDVFCTDQESNNKPLSIMGDVYRYCTECVCMLDIKLPGFVHEPSESWHEHGWNAIHNHLVEILECKWGRRVWTLQEWILPPKISYTEETFEGRFCTVDPDVLGKAFHEADESDFRSIVQFTKIRESVAYEYIISRGKDVVGHLMFGKRECKNPEDYYYGIAGIFELDLPNGLKFEEVEKIFLSKFNARNNTYRATRSNGNFEGIYKRWVLNDMRDNIVVSALANYDTGRMVENIASSVSRSFSERLLDLLSSDSDESSNDSDSD
jgi:hypothetical protein